MSHNIKPSKPSLQVSFIYFIIITSPLILRRLSWKGIRTLDVARINISAISFKLTEDCRNVDGPNVDTSNVCCSMTFSWSQGFAFPGANCCVENSHAICADVKDVCNKMGIITRVEQSRVLRNVDAVQWSRATSIIALFCCIFGASST